MHRLPALLASTFILSAATHGADWNHYRGPAQNGSTPERIATFPVGGPRVLWRVQLGTGLSSVTVAGDRVFSAGYRDKKEVLYCLNAANGGIVWMHSWAAKLGDYLFEGGPRATPTVDGDRVYMLGADGHVACVAAATGKPLWERNLVSEFGGRRPEWGFSGSPTIDGKNVILDSGGKGASTVVLNKLTGELVWKSGDDEAGYGSAVVADFGGKKTVLVLKADALVGYDAAGGKELWRFDWKTSYKVNAATPLVIGNKVVISAAYNHGAAAVRVTGSQAVQDWFTRSLHAHFNTPVQYAGHVYGFDGEAGKRHSALVCLDAASGDEKWRTTEFRSGSLVLAGDRLLVLSEGGDLILAEASPAGFKALGRSKVLTGRCWVQPTLSNGRVYCRNNNGELVALGVVGK
jgi:outer membrane protein assembly factor BamB